MPVEVFNVYERFATQEAQLLKLLVAGPAGAGKTRFASTFPNPIYADAEGLLMSVRDRPVRAVTINTIKDLEDLRSELNQRPDIRAKRLGGPVDTVVIDTVDHVARLMKDERQRAEKKEAFTVADWGIHGDRLRDLLRGFRNLDMHVIFNVHVKEEKDEEIGRISIVPRVQGAVGGELADYVNESFLLRSRTMTDPKTGERIPVRYLQTYSDSQVTWLKDHSGALPLEVPVDFETDYERLAKAIFGGVAPPAPRPSVRVQEIADWQPTPTEPIDANAPDAPAADQPVAEAPPAPAKRAVKKRARSQLDTSDGLLQGEAAQGDVIAAPEPQPEPATHPDTAVPEKGTETTEPAAESAATPEAADPEAKACAVCGTTDINEDYLELSEARWGQYLCRTHFLERNKQK